MKQEADSRDNVMNTQRSNQQFVTKKEDEQE